jgi:acyl-CoA thioesterase
MLQRALREHIKVPDAGDEICATRRPVGPIGHVGAGDTTLKQGVVRPCMTENPSDDDAGSGQEEVDDDVAERIRGDAYCDTLGIDLTLLEPGFAVTELVVTDDLLNFHGTPHGGAVYSVADAAFAAASNSRGDPAVALETNVSYLNAVDAGDTLTATAEETHVGGRTAEYEVVVTSGGERIATFRGRVYLLEG